MFQNIVSEYLDRKCVCHFKFLPTCTFSNHLSVSITAMNMVWSPVQMTVRYQWCISKLTPQVYYHRMQINSEARADLCLSFCNPLLFVPTIRRQVLQSSYWKHLPAASTIFWSMLNLTVISTRNAKARTDHLLWSLLWQQTWWNSCGH